MIVLRFETQSIGNLARSGFCIRRVLPAIGLLLLVGCSQGRMDAEQLTAQTNQALVVGNNDLKDIAQSTDRAKFFAKSVGILFEDDVLGTCTATDCTVKTKSSQYCSGTGLPAGDQGLATTGFCTAFFIGKDRVVTAGHCVMPEGATHPTEHQYECMNRLLALDWEKDAAGNSPTTISRSKLFRCMKVIAHGGALPPGFESCTADGAAKKTVWPKCSIESPGTDWAVMRVEPYDVGGTPAYPEPVIIGTGPLPVAATTNGLVIGHPDGTPKKADANASIRAAIIDPTYSIFEFDGDVTPGSSGGPVMDRATGMVYGLVSAFPAHAEWGVDIDTGVSCKTHTQCTAKSGKCVHGSEATSLLRGIWSPRKEVWAQLETVTFDDGMAIGLPLPVTGGYNGVVVRNDAGVIRLSLTDSGNTYTDIAYFASAASASAARTTAGFTGAPIASLPIAAFGDFTGDAVPEAIVGIDGHSYYLSSTELSSLVSSPNSGYELPLTPSYDYLVADHALFMPDDINGDGILDIRAIRNDGSEDQYCGSASGLSSTCKGAGIRVDLAGDGITETVSLSKNGSGYATWAANGNGPHAFGTFAYAEPIVTTTGNFNGDHNATTKLPFTDFAFLAGGKPCVGLSSTGGGVNGRYLEFASTDNFVALRTGDSLGDDGLDDLEAVRDDGVVRIYQGLATGSDGDGLKKTGVDFTGLPSADGGDGKFLTVTGQGLGTIDRPTGVFEIAVDSSKTSFSVQIFDGDMGGTNDLIREGTPLNQTCFRLLIDPLGNGTGGEEVISKTADMFGDNRWGTLYNGSTDSRALNGNTYFYTLNVFLAPNCSAPTDPTIAAFNAFKVRTDAQVSFDHSETSIIGLDAWGPRSAGTPAAPDLILNDTDYDGVFKWFIDVDGAGTKVHLREADADRTDDEHAAGQSNGKNAIAAFSVYGPVGESSAPLTVNGPTHPSGNYDISTVSDRDEHDYTIDVDSSLIGTWLWKWTNVDSINNIHIYAAEASPVNYAMFGAAQKRRSPSQAVTVGSWSSQLVKAQAYLPVVLGQVNASGALIGDSIQVSTSATAAAVLAGISGSSLEQLRAQLLAAKLNMIEAPTRGEPLAAGFVYGRTTTVQQVADDSDAFLATGTGDIFDLLRLTAAINGAKITFRGPRATDPSDPTGDDDADGVINLYDNCPTTVNAFQLDSNGNGKGDACECPELLAVPPSKGVVSVLYRNPDSNPTDNSFRPQIQLVNNSKTSIALQDVTLRYWYTNESTRAQTFNVDYATMGAAKLRGSFARPVMLRKGANSYLEVGFVSGAGTLAPSQSTGEIQTRVSAVQWPNFNETDDYSRDTNTSYTENVRVTAYVKGLLVWGQEPAPAYCYGGPYSLGTGVRADYRVGDIGAAGDNQLRPVLSITNTGVTDIPLQELTAKYCYTLELPAAEQVSVDYSALASGSLLPVIVPLDVPRPSADRCLELSFAASAGTLLAGAATGEIQLRVNKATWTQYDESNDYSYVMGQSALAANAKVTVYRNGELLWGVKP